MPFKIGADMLTFRLAEGADKIDVGNYKPGTGFAHAAYCACAAEFGEKDLNRDLLEEVDTNMHPLEPSPSGTGALQNKGLSMIANGSIFRSRLMRKGDWANLINSPRDDRALNGVKLDKVPFPQVMVARCHVGGQADDGLDFVLCGLSHKGKITITFKDLKSKAQYVLSAIKNGQKEEVVSGIRAGPEGWVEVQVEVAERSEFELRVMA